MLNCAWRPRINNYILNFRLDHFSATLFCSSNNQIPLWLLFEKSASQKWILCDKRLFPIFVYVQFGFISLVPNSLWYIEWVFTSCLSSSSEASFVAKNSVMFKRLSFNKMSVHSSPVVLLADHKRIPSCQTHFYTPLRFSKRQKETRRS